MRSPTKLLLFTSRPSVFSKNNIIFYEKGWTPLPEILTQRTFLFLSLQNQVQQSQRMENAVVTWPGPDPCHLSNWWSWSRT